MVDGTGSSNEDPQVGRASGARNDLVRGIMEDALEKRQCPFCPPAFERSNGGHEVRFERLEPVLWNVWHSLSPLDGTRYHIMLAPKRHLEPAGRLRLQEEAELGILINQLQQQYGFGGYSVLARRGDPRFNSATVYHLHWHVIVSSGEAADPGFIPAAYVGILGDVVKLVAEWDEDILEALGYLRDYIDMYIEAQRGRAVPIRAKLSRSVGDNQA